MNPVTDRHGATEPCSCCGEPVVIADVLDGSHLHVNRLQLPIEPKPLLPEPDLLLHLGQSSDSGRWLLVPLGDEAGERCRRALPLPHAHRQHVCAAVPAAWLDTKDRVNA